MSEFDRSGLLGAVFRALKYAEDRRIAHGDLHFGNVILPDEVPSIVRLEGGQIAIGESIQLIDCGTSILSGDTFSAKRHAKLLRDFTFKLLPELTYYCKPLPTFYQLSGFDMLPQLEAAHSFYGDMTNGIEMERLGIEMPAHLNKPEDNAMRLGRAISELKFFAVDTFLLRVKEAKGAQFTRAVKWAMALFISEGENLDWQSINPGLIRIMEGAGFVVDDAARSEIESVS